MSEETKQPAREHAEEIDLNDEEEAALDRAWERLGKEEAAKPRTAGDLIRELGQDKP